MREGDYALSLRSRCVELLTRPSILQYKSVEFKLSTFLNNIIKKSGLSDCEKIGRAITVICRFFTVLCHILFSQQNIIGFTFRFLPCPDCKEALEVNVGGIKGKCRDYYLLWKSSFHLDEKLSHSDLIKRLEAQRCNMCCAQYIFSDSILWTLCATLK